MQKKQQEDCKFYHKAYSTEPALVRIAEREAYTFQQLTEEAQKVLYPEAYNLRKEYIKRCNETEESGTSMKMEF